MRQDTGTGHREEICVLERAMYARQCSWRRGFTIRGEIQSPGRELVGGRQRGVGVQRMERNDRIEVRDRVPTTYHRQGAMASQARLGGTNGGVIQAPKPKQLTPQAPRGATSLLVALGPKESVQHGW